MFSCSYPTSKKKSSPFSLYEHVKQNPVMGFASTPIKLFYCLLFLSSVAFVHGVIPTTLEGPFKPVTAPLDNSLHGKGIDLPNTDPRFRRSDLPFRPEQISVSLSSNYDSVWISWITGEFELGDYILPLDPESVKSVVQYGFYRTGITYEEIGYSLVYRQQYPYEGLKKYASGIIHHVQLTGLEPDTLYQYQCGDPFLPAMSDAHYFRTMPMSTITDYPRRIVVVGDLGLSYNTTSTIGHLLSSHPDLVLLIGGISYADLYLTNGTGFNCSSCSLGQNPIRETYQPRWDYWGRFMQPLIANVPIMMAAGEHEIEEQADNLTFVAYSSRFVFPYEESSSSSTLYYSFNAGGIHFVVLGAYVSYDKSSDQYVWLESDLANVDRSVTPWLVAAWYPSWYSTYKAHYREAECMKVEMEELLYSYGVDIVFNGHVHAYERSNRVYNYSLDQCGPVYIIVGDGGTQEMIATEHADEPGNCPDPSTMPENYIGGFCAFNFTSGPAAGQFCWNEQPDYSAYRESSFGYGILEVKNETHALWTWHRNQNSYLIAGDVIYIVRQPDECGV